MPKTPFERMALKNVSLTIKDGSFTAIAGHTGSGKSTLVQHLNGLLHPTAGQVLVDGVDLAEKKSPAAKKARQSVGMVFQYPEHQIFAETVPNNQTRPSFARDFIAFRHIYDKNSGIRQFRAKSSGKVITAAFNKYKLNIRKLLHHIVYSLQIHGRILANSSMRATPCFHADNSFLGQNAVFAQKFRILFGVNIVCYNSQTVLICQSAR